MAVQVLAVKGIIRKRAYEVVDVHDSKFIVEKTHIIDDYRLCRVDFILLDTLKKAMAESSMTSANYLATPRHDDTWLNSDSNL